MYPICPDLNSTWPHFVKIPTLMVLQIKSLLAVSLVFLHKCGPSMTRHMLLMNSICCLPPFSVLSRLSVSFNWDPLRVPICVWIRVAVQSNEWKNCPIWHCTLCCSFFTGIFFLFPLCYPPITANYISIYHTRCPVVALSECNDWACSLFFPKNGNQRVSHVPGNSSALIRPVDKKHWKVWTEHEEKTSAV